MGASSNISGGDKATAEQYNNLRKDVVDTTSGHDHDGTDSKQVDHGGLGGLADDDHSQYWNDARGVVGVKTVKLDDLTAPDDNTDLNASTSKHGLLLKLDNTATNYLDGTGAWSVPAGAGFASGTYTGDGTSDRQITTGFLCKAVFIQRQVAGAGVSFFVLLNVEGDSSLKIEDTDQVDDVAKPYLHASDGFIVSFDADGANYDGGTYKYVAFG